MLFLHGVLKGKKGFTVKVDFSHPTKIKLIKDKEFRNYKLNKPYRFYGGFFEQSPAYIPFPSSGVWHVVIEKGSLKNPLPVTAKIEVIKGVYTNENPPSSIAPMPQPEQLPQENNTANSETEEEETNVVSNEEDDVTSASDDEHQEEKKEE
jgi:hypothetical protein